MALLYALVWFPDENTTAVVPTSWIKEDVCKYPSKSSGQIEELIQQNHVPDISWPSYTAAIIKNYQTYQAALLDLPRSKETSNSETEGEETRKIKIKPNRYLFNYPEKTSSEEEDIQHSQTVPSSPKLQTMEQENISPNQAIPENTSNKQASSNNQKLQHINHTSLSPSQQKTLKIKLQHINHTSLTPSLQKTLKINHHTPATPQHDPEQINHNFQSNNLLYSPNKGPTTNQQTLKLAPIHTLQNGFSPMHNQDHQAKKISITDDEIWQGLLRIQSNIAELSTMVKNLETKVNALVEMRKPRAEDAIPDADQEKLVSFLPLDTMETFIDLENELATNKHLQGQIVKMFASYGGHDVRSHTLNIMRRLMTDNLATYFSYTGKKATSVEKTTPFGPTLICQKVQSAVLKSYPNATESSIKKHLMVFLNQAKTRIIRKESKGAQL